MMTSSPFRSSKPPAVIVESDVVQDLARWLIDRRAHGCVRVLLAQRIGESNHHPVEESGFGELDDAIALAQSLYAVGFREAQATRASLAYGVFAFRGDRPDPDGRYLFRVEPGHGLGWQEPATTSNDDRSELLKMLMGHTDMSARLALGHSRGILDQYERLIEQSNTQQGRLLEQAHARIAALEARELEALELREKLQAMLTERETETAKDKLKQQNLHYTLDRIMTIAPLIFSSVTATRAQRTKDASTPSSPGGPTAEPEADVEGLLERFVRSLTPAQTGVLGDMLSPEQLTILVTLFQIARARNPSAWPPAADAEPNAPEAPASPAAAAAQAAAAPAVPVPDPAVVASSPTIDPTRDGTPSS